MIEQLKGLIRRGNAGLFYTQRPWRNKRKETLTADKNECQHCKAKGIYSRATQVHHVKHLLDNPELALEDTYIDDDSTERRQLISLCDDCHKAEHLPPHDDPEHTVTLERWD